MLRGIRHGVGKLVKATVPEPTGAHIIRYTMYQRMAEALRDWPRKSGRVLAVSHSEDLAKTVGVSTEDVVRADYPDVNLLALPFEDEAFDFVVADQVLEHVEGDPQTAIDECHRVLRPGGLAIHTTCFINPRHGAPSDFWRFTPEALALLCAKFSKIIDVGGWGNPFVWAVAGLGLVRQPVPHATWHPLHKLATYHDPAWSVSTWVIAEK